jgi:hypothetical protein
MASQAQIDANRRNALKSTGPKTEAGKARASLNALKDGSHAKTVNRVLPQENAAEGCHWLLDRWIGLRVLLDRKSEWTYGDMFCLIRLLGKYPVEAINDPKINAIFLAWDAMDPGRGEWFWKECKRCKPLQDPGFSDYRKWREIAERPADATAAIKFFEQLVDEQVARLEELLELHEEIVGDEAAELGDRVSSDSSARGDRLRREQTAKSRELRQTIELLITMRKAEYSGQTGDDGGKEDDEKTAPETPAPARAPKAATYTEGQREPGSTARSVARKRPNDEYRSMTALEMVMANRLGQQAFDLCVEDPLAELAAVEGSSVLAEPRVLSGRASVQSRRSATSELGMKNARIEGHRPKSCDGHSVQT